MLEWLQQIHLQWLTGLLVFVRVGAAVVVMPVYGARQVPTPVRVGLSAALALVVTPLLEPVEFEGLLPFISLAIKEGIVGLVIGLVATIIFAAVLVAGEMLDVQSGLAIASVVNPSSGFRSTLLGQVKYTLAMLVFMTTGAYQHMIRGVVYSYRWCGLDELTLRPLAASGLLSMIANILLVAVQMAAPVAAALFLTEVAMGLANRALPQMNVMILALPVKALVAVIMLGIALPGVVFVMMRLFDGLGSDIATLVSTLGPAGAPAK